MRRISDFAVFDRPRWDKIGVPIAKVAARAENDSFEGSGTARYTHMVRWLTERIASIAEPGEARTSSITSKEERGNG